MNTYNGILLDDYGKWYFKKRELDVKRRFVKFFNTDTSIDEIRKYIKDNDIKYMILSFSSKFLDKPMPDFGIPVIVGTGDSPRRISDDTFKNFCIKNNVVGITTHNKCTVEPIKDYFEPMDVDVFFFKWGIDMDIMKDYGLRKDIDISNTGKFSRYQFRRELHTLLFNSKEINYKRIRQPNPETDLRNLYEGYSRNINKSWISVGGCMQEAKIAYYKGKFISDTFPKNIEIPASNSCLLTSEWGDREFLGFKDEKNCIIFKNVRDARRKCLYYLDDKELLERMIKSGYGLTHKNHDIKNTIPDLMNRIEEKYV